MRDGLLRRLCARFVSQFWCVCLCVRAIQSRAVIYWEAKGGEVAKRGRGGEDGTANSRSGWGTLACRGSEAGESASGVMFRCGEEGGCMLCVVSTGGSWQNMYGRRQNPSLVLLFFIALFRSLPSSPPMTASDAIKVRRTRRRECGRCEERKEGNKRAEETEGR